LLQQTDVGHVLNVYDKFFEKFPTVKELADAGQEEIEKTIKSLGFWRTRAKDLKCMAKQLLEEHHGQIPCNKQKLQDLSGIGEYIASAVSCFGFGNKEAIVDVNVRRVAKRLFFWENQLPNDKELLGILINIIPDSHSRDFNWAILDFAAIICTKAPKCNICFAKRFCKYYLKMNTTDQDKK
jgi:A/G-specific adenine glycosylase